MSSSPVSAEWFAARQPDPLRDLLGRTADCPRRLRLFGCGCVRQMWHLLTGEARSAVLVSERLADNRATLTDLRAAALCPPSVAITPAQLALTATAWATARVYRPSDPPTLPLQHSPFDAARYAARAYAAERAGSAPSVNPVPPSWHAAWTAAYEQARAVQAAIFRDIFPPPGYTPSLAPDWATDTVRALAHDIDDRGDYSACPILADALQDAGCQDRVILDCCRAPEGVHVRGNWVVDLLLGRL